MLKIYIKGCGVAALTTAWEFSKKNCEITIAAPVNSPIGSSSWYAGGMLAPYCEAEIGGKFVQEKGLISLKWWQENFPQFVTNNGTLVLAKNRDLTQLQHFANCTEQHQWLDQLAIENLEPSLAENFSHALYFKSEGHIDPRKTLPFIKSQLQSKNVIFSTDIQASINPNNYDYIIDCTGTNQINKMPELRGVRGEMIIIKCKELTIKRSIRLLHPRIPLYIVPRENQLFMIGATMIESESEEPITARSLMELLNAAYSINCNFANAQIIETNAATRPAFANNLPDIKYQGKYIYINGFYRHGYLLAPYLAMQLAEKLCP